MTLRYSPPLPAQNGIILGRGVDALSLTLSSYPERESRQNILRRWSEKLPPALRSEIPYALAQVGVDKVDELDKKLLLLVAQSEYRKRNLSEAQFQLDKGNIIQSVSFLNQFFGVDHYRDWSKSLIESKEVILQTIATGLASILELPDIKVQLVGVFTKNKTLVAMARYKRDRITSELSDLTLLVSRDIQDISFSNTIFSSLHEAAHFYQARLRGKLDQSISRPPEVTSLIEEARERQLIGGQRKSTYVVSVTERHADAFGISIFYGLRTLSDFKVLPGVSRKFLCP